MPYEDTELTVGLKPGLTVALAARTASEHASAGSEWVGGNAAR